MARSKNSNNKKAKPRAKEDEKDGGRKQQQKQQEQKKARIVTMQALRELSDDGDDDELPVDESQWDEKAQALKAAIESGRFDQAIRASANNNKKDDDDDDEAFEEASLNDDDEDEADGGDVEAEEGEEELAAADNDDDVAEMAAGDIQEVERGDDDGDDDNDEEEDEEENSDEEDHGDEAKKATFSSTIRDGGNDDDGEDDIDEEEEDGDDDDMKQSRFPSPDQRNSYHAKALRVLAEELDSKTRGWPWAETFDVMPKDPLPFDIKGPTAEGAVSIHDDLKREVTFYDVALKAVLQAKSQCADAKIPFSRPEDFFAEMVKSDEHMARVKDRLIFETKKMDAVAARKSNKEQKLRSKEAKSNKLAEKAKRKKDHFRAVEEWAETAKANRGQSLDDRDNVDSHFDKKKKYNSGAGGKNSKREWADKKYGYGGPRGRFKQNDPASLNDMSSYNPRGNNFPGGTKYTSSMSKNVGSNNNNKRKRTGSSGAGAHRPGKRSRDAKRSGQKAR